MKQLRVVVVDDSRVFRTQLAGAIDASGCARVIGHAGDGAEALRRVGELSPDVVTLDVEMPVMGGLATLVELRKRHPAVRVVMVSGLTREGAELTIRALELGAHDFVTKPHGPDRQENVERLRSSVRAMLSSMSGENEASVARGTPKPSVVKRARRPDIVAIGSSTGGPAALQRILPGLPSSLAVPVIVVQHMPPLFTSALATSLASKSKMRVVEITDGTVLAQGCVYVAPGGRHVRLVSLGVGGRRAELTDDPPENFCRPAVDYTFRSVAEVYGDAALGVILTGMGKDGTAGLREMKLRGARVIAQDEASCVVYGMPREAKMAGVVDLELPLDRISDAIVASVQDSSSRA